jgi:hypothetical protein
MFEKTITIGELPPTAPLLVGRGIPIAKLDICHLPFVNAIVAGTNHKTQEEALSSMVINCSDIIAPGQKVLTNIPYLTYKLMYIINCHLSVPPTNIVLVTVQRH